MGETTMSCFCGAKRRRLNGSAQNSEDASCGCMESGCAPVKCLSSGSLPVITTGVLLRRVAQSAGRAAGSPTPKIRKRLQDSGEGSCFVAAPVAPKQTDNSCWRVSKSETYGRSSKLNFSLELRPLTLRGSRDGVQSRKRHSYTDASPTATTAVFPRAVASSTCATSTSASDTPRHVTRFLSLRPIPASEHFARLQTPFPVAALVDNSTHSPQGLPQRVLQLREFSTSASISTSTPTNSLTVPARATAEMAGNTPSTDAREVPLHAAPNAVVTPFQAAACIASQRITSSDAVQARQSTVVAGKPYALCSADCTDSTATSAETPAPPPPPQLHVRAYGGGSDGHSRQMLVVDVEVAAVPADAAVKMRSGAGSCEPPLGQRNMVPGAVERRPLRSSTAAGAGAAISAPAPAPAPAPGAAAVVPSAATGACYKHPGCEAAAAEEGRGGCAAEGQAMRRMLLRLWPLASPSPSRANEALQARAGLPSRGSDGPACDQHQPHEQRHAQIQAQTRSDAAVAAQTSKAVSISQSQPQPQPQETAPASALQPALAGLERLLGAAEGAAEAVVAVTKTLSKAGAGTGLTLGDASLGSGQCARDAVRLLPTHRVDPEAFFEVDGRLLQGAVLHTACQVIRLAQQGSHLCILPPWKQQTGVASPVGTARSSSSSNNANGGAPAAGSGRRVVPLATILAALVSFTGAARALQRAQAQGNAAAADGLMALLPLMRQGHLGAEALMAEVERVLTSPPPAQMA